MRRALVTAVGTAIASFAQAAPGGGFDACFVRVDPPAAAASAANGAPLQSHVGIRRRTAQLFDLDVSVSAPGPAVCQVSGTAKLRGDAGSEELAMVVRPDPGRRSGRSGTLCQVFVRLTPAGLTLRTTPSSCQAQALCDGRVELDGQRFDASMRVPAGTSAPCFAKAAPG